ncbi:MAG: phenylalanine--tRNA ligase subunit beta [Cyanobacteria bacterium RI_101]|nr:phenylalanine--tRNA ligase subunit beta [Cyanobacteria bacterium RI_101]
MRISVNWLQTLAKFSQSPEELAELLTIAGLEVEEIEDRRAWADGVVVGKVLERRQHPNADKLSLCQVDVGQEAPLQIVCGAANVRGDILVPVATVGTYLPAVDLKLKPTKLRGERSEGMICSLAELGLEKNSEGIHIFTDPQLAPGQDVRPLLGLDDVIIEISPTANRADALSLTGIAREVAALTGAPLTLPEVQPEELKPAPGLSVEISNPQACPAYFGTLVTGVKIAPSPPWLQRRLQSGGVRPINNVVDITNYVLLEWGQPLHAFDWDKLRALVQQDPLTLGVRFAQPGESLETLDGQKRELTPQNLLITANDQPVALAGVMGGAATEVDEGTQNILLETALFNSVAIRRSGKSQNLRSESSTRYERGVNPWQLETACQRALDLLREVAGGEIQGQASADYRPQEEPQPITLRLTRLQSVLGPVKSADGEGEAFPAEDAERILTALGCQLTPSQTDPLVWSVAVPPHRRGDLEREIDLIEEAARLYGYDHFLPQLPAKTVPGVLSPEFQSQRRVRAVLEAAGLTEVVHYSLVKPQGPEVVLANPLLAEYGALRTNLLDGLITAFAYNQAQGNGALNAFEMGRIFWRDGEEIQEGEALAGILGGDAFPQGRWTRGGKSEPLTWYEAKGRLDSAFERLGLNPTYRADPGDHRYHPGRTAVLTLGKERLGRFGQLHPQLRREQDLMDAVYAFEFNLDVLYAALASQGTQPFQPYSPYPPVTRDLALFAPLTVSAAQLVQTMEKAGQGLLESAELFDQYLGENVPEGQRSLAFSLTYRLPDRTLADEDVEPAHNRIRSALASQWGATLRS